MTDTVASNAPGAMNDRVKAAFVSASDLAKQLLTLSTGVLGITVTFSKDLIERLTETGRWRLEIAWILLACSLLAGIWALMALTGALGNRTSVSDSDLKVYRPSIQIPFVLQVALFVVGLGFLVYAGMALIDIPTPPQPSSQ